MFRSYADGGDNPALVTFATETRPVLEQHLEQAQALSSAR